MPLKVYIEANPADKSPIDKEDSRYNLQIAVPTSCDYSVVRQDNSEDSGHHKSPQSAFLGDVSTVVNLKPRARSTSRAIKSSSKSGSDLTKPGAKYADGQLERTRSQHDKPRGKGANAWRRKPRSGKVSKKHSHHHKRSKAKSDGKNNRVQAPSNVGTKDITAASKKANNSCKTDPRELCAKREHIHKKKHKSHAKKHSGHAKAVKDVAFVSKTKGLKADAIKGNEKEKVTGKKSKSGDDQRTRESDLKAQMTPRPSNEELRRRQRKADAVYREQHQETYAMRTENKLYDERSSEKTSADVEFIQIGSRKDTAPKYDQSINLATTATSLYDDNSPFESDWGTTDKMTPSRKLSEYYNMGYKGKEQRKRSPRTPKLPSNHLEVPRDNAKEWNRKYRQIHKDTYAIATNTKLGGQQSVISPQSLANADANNCRMMENCPDLPLDKSARARAASIRDREIGKAYQKASNHRTQHGLLASEPRAIRNPMKLLRRLLLLAILVGLLLYFLQRGKTAQFFNQIYLFISVLCRCSYNFGYCQVKCFWTGQDTLTCYRDVNLYIRSAFSN